MKSVRHSQGFWHDKETEEVTLNAAEDNNLYLTNQDLLRTTTPQDMSAQCSTHVSTPTKKQSKEFCV